MRVDIVHDELEVLDVSRCLNGDYDIPEKLYKKYVRACKKFMDIQEELERIKNE